MRGAANNFEHHCMLQEALETHRGELGSARETGHFVVLQNARLLSEESEKEILTTTPLECCPRRIIDRPMLCRAM